MHCAAVRAEMALSDPEAVKLAQRGCALGDVEACEVATDAILSDPSHDESLAYATWRAACEGGIGRLCWAWGLAELAEKKAASDGGEPEKEPDSSTRGMSAYAAFVRGCQRGSRPSCYEAAQLRRRGRGQGGYSVEDLLLASCPEGEDVHWGGCMQLGAIREKNGSGALALYERVCEMKVKVGCRHAARLHEKASRSDLAEQMYGKGCRLGDTDACMRAAALAPKERAREWNEEACSRFGHREACETLKGK